MNEHCVSARLVDVLVLHFLGREARERWGPVSERRSSFLEKECIMHGKQIVDAPVLQILKNASIR